MVKAIAVLKGDSPVKGIVTFEQEENAPIKITGELSGMDANAERGFHIHVYGDNTNGCSVYSIQMISYLLKTSFAASAGPHFNPNQKKHGGPDDAERHAGDLGNIKTDGSGNAKVDITDKHLSLFGSGSIIGRTVVVHAGKDDLGKGGNEESTKTGNAGGRAACGVIGIAA